MCTTRIKSKLIGTKLRIPNKQNSEKCQHCGSSSNLTHLAEPILKSTMQCFKELICNKSQTHFLIRHNNFFFYYSHDIQSFVPINPDPIRIVHLTMMSESFKGDFYIRWDSSRDILKQY